DQLGGRSVVLVTLPGADGDSVRPLTNTLTAAGAKVTGRIDIQDAWADPANRAARDKAVAALAGVAGGGAGTLVPSPSRSARATQAVVLAPGVAPAVPNQPAPATSTGPDVTPTWLTLARELDTSSTGAVVVGPASAAAAGGVLAAVRAQSQLAGSLSTVDTGG